MTTWPRAALLCVIMTLTGCVPWAELRKRIDEAEAKRLFCGEDLAQQRHAADELRAEAVHRALGA